MSNETDLDWLARNVHEWRECDYAAMRGVVERVIWIGAIAYGQMPELKSAVTRDQWLARRAELQGKPSWSKAEEWAGWLAQDSYGCWGFFQKKPLMHALSWIARSGYYQIHSPGNSLLGDWRNTLEKRPERDEFKPFASIEDNQELSMTQQQVKQDNGWFERGELPPVGIECEAKKYGKEEYYKVVICGAGKHLGLAVAFYEKQKGSGAFTCSSAEYFRPIRAERDVLLSVIVEEMNHYDTDGKLADSILAAGFSLRAK